MATSFGLPLYKFGVRLFKSFGPNNPTFESTVLGVRADGFWVSGGVGVGGDISLSAGPSILVYLQTEA
jgi:hypothetical protein